MYTFKYKDLSKGQGGGQVFLNVKQHFFYNQNSGLVSDSVHTSIESLRG